MADSEEQQSTNYQKFRINIKDYKILKQLQSGGYGTVYSVQNIKTSNIYAAKVLNTHSDEAQYKKMIDREIGIMILCQHPTIIKFIGFSTYDFNEQKNITIFMELAKRGSLAEFLQKVQKGIIEELYDNTKKQIILVGIARGMMFLHQHQIIHRDLKPGNILLDKELHPLITDFGLSKFNEASNSVSQSQQCGTSMYMAPEIIEGNRYNGKIDVYSFGILMYEVVTNSIPYPLLCSGKMSAYSFNKKVIDENYRPQFDHPINKSIQKLIESCWSKNPKERPTFEQLFKKLAYNIDDSNTDVYEDFDETEEDNNYYLEDVDINEVISYANDIDNLITTTTKEKVDETENKLVIELIEKNVNPLKKENEEIRNQIVLIQKEKDREINTLKDEVSALKKIIEEEKEERNSEIEKLKQEYEEQFKALQELIKNKPDQIPDSSPVKVDTIDEKIFKSKLEEIIKKRIDEIEKINQQKKIFIDTVLAHFKDNNSYETFNNLNGESQNIIIKEFINNNEANKIVSNINELLNFLSKESINNDQIKYISIQAKEQKQQLFNNFDDIDKIIIHEESIQMIIEKGLLDSVDFIKIINNFDDIYIELNYPSNEYQQIFPNIANLKQSTQFDLKVDVIISRIEDHDKTFQNNKYINAIKILPEVKVITGGYQNGFFEGCSLTEINIPETVTLICGGALNSCTNLKKIIFPSSIKTIEGGAFGSCISLTKIIIPPTVEYIGQFGFMNCSNLREIEINPYKTRIERNTFNQCPLLNHLTFSPGIEFIEKFNFDDYWKLTKISIPTSATAINASGFSNCTTLQEIIIPSSVTTIGNNVFSGCASLKEITIPSSVTTIGDNAFSGCTSLKEITIPSSVTTIGDNAFYGCTSLDNFNDASETIRITKNRIIDSSRVHELYRKRLFDSANFLLEIKNSLNTIIQIQYPSNVFEKIYRIVVRLKEAHKSIQICIIVSSVDSKFYQDQNIDMIQIESNVQTIKSDNFKGSFEGCSSLTKVDIPPSVTLIDNNSFKRCSKLTEITIPSSVTSIKDNVFAECTSLAEITIPSSVTSIGCCSFYGCTSLKQINIPSSVKTIGYCAFYNCTSLKQITIPSSVTSIGYSAFLNCSSLSEVKLSTSLREIGKCTFQGCTSLKTIDVPSHIKINKSAFPSSTYIKRI